MLTSCLLVYQRQYFIRILQRDGNIVFPNVSKADCSTALLPAAGVGAAQKGGCRCPLRMQSLPAKIRPTPRLNGIQSRIWEECIGEAHHKLRLQASRRRVSRALGEQHGA